VKELQKFGVGTSVPQKYSHFMELYLAGLKSLPQIFEVLSQSQERCNEKKLSLLVTTVNP